MSKRKNVHEFTNNKGETRFAVAVWDEKAGQFTAPLDKSTAKLTGCFAEFARTLSGIGGYLSKKQAVSRARYLYGYSKTTGDRYD